MAIVAETVQYSAELIETKKQAQQIYYNTWPNHQEEPHRSGWSRGGTCDCEGTSCIIQLFVVHEGCRTHSMHGDASYAGTHRMVDPIRKGPSWGLSVMIEPPLTLTLTGLDRPRMSGAQRHHGPDLPVSSQPRHQKVKRGLTAPDPARLQIASSRRLCMAFRLQPRGMNRAASSRVEYLGRRGSADATARSVVSSWSVGGL